MLTACGLWPRLIAESVPRRNVTGIRIAPSIMESRNAVSMLAKRSTDTM